MPTYQYRDKAGRLHEAILPVCERDDLTRASEACGYRVFARVPVPVTVDVSGRQDPGDADVAMPKALAEQEHTVEGRRRLERESGFSVQELKRIWGRAG